jgi:tRNA threonylcarbamoyladenosine biosynthesis protein TsaE
MEFIYRETELQNIVKEVWEKCKSHKIWAFYAPMGAGKTTFIHTLCDHLQVTDHVSSPTFAIVNEYASSAGSLYHMDWYRLKDSSEAIDAGVEDILSSDNYCFIEWPEKAAELLPYGTIELQIEIIDESTRKLTVTV